MRFRPCIDIHNGNVKQIVGSSLKDEGDLAKENFVSSKDAAFFARMYKEKGLYGGHIIVLNSAESPYYEASVNQALSALKETPGCLQVGGGITAENAWKFLDAGASHVIVTSYVFKDGKVNYENLRRLVSEVGKEHIVLDLSCRKKLFADRTLENADIPVSEGTLENVKVTVSAGTLENDEAQLSEVLGNSNKKTGDYFIVTDRWQKMTMVELNADTLDEFSSYCDEFLIHAVDVEGKQSGIETELATLLGNWGRIPITYAGGVHNYKDLDILRKCGKGKLDVTIGSALDIFGGTMNMDEVISILGE